MKNYRKIFGLHKPEFTTAISETNRTIQQNSDALDKNHPSRFFDGNFCSCLACGRFQTQKDMSIHRHAQEVENSQRKRGELQTDHYGYIRKK